MYRATRFEARARLRFRAFIQSQGTNSFYWPLIWRESLYDGFNVGVFNLKVCVDFFEVETLHFPPRHVDGLPCFCWIRSCHFIFFLRSSSLSISHRKSSKRRSIKLDSRQCLSWRVQEVKRANKQNLMKREAPFDDLCVHRYEPLSFVQHGVWVLSISTHSHWSKLSPRWIPIGDGINCVQLVSQMVTLSPPSSPPSPRPVHYT